MLGFIYRLIRQFEHQHGIQPNLLYLNYFHVQHLKAAFEQQYSLPQIMDVLGMELVVESDISHPHVAWTQVADKVVAF